MLVSSVTELWGQSKKYVPVNLLTQEDGLISVNVRKILRDRYGFLWLATQGGLSRFDGRNFVNYLPFDEDPLHRLLNSDVADISFSADSAVLYAVTPYGGVTIVDVQTGNVVRQCPLAKLAGGTPITVTGCISSKNALFIGTDEGYFLKYDPARQHVTRQLFFMTAGKPAYSISNYIVQDEKVCIFLSDGYVHQYSADLRLISRTCIDRFADTVNGFQVNRILPLEKDLYILATNKGVLFYNALKNIIEPAMEQYQAIAHFFKGSNCREIYIYGGLIWVVSNNHLWKYSKHTNQFIEYLAARDPEMQMFIGNARSLIQIRKSLYIVSGEGVAAIPDVDCPFTAYYKSFSNDQVKIPAASGMCMKDSSLLIAASDGIYREYDNDLSKVYSGKDIYFVSPLGDDHLIVSQASRTFLLDRHFREVKISRVFPELRPLEQDLIISSVNIGDSLLLFASDNARGVYYWYPRKKKLLMVNTGTDGKRLTAITLNALYYTEDRSRVIMLCDNQLTVYDIRRDKVDNISLHNPATAQPLNIILDICESQNSFWAAVYGVGIVQMDRHFNIMMIYGPKEGLPSGNIYKIIPYRDEALFVSSDRGIILFNIKEHRVRLFTKEEGLSSNEFDEYSGLRHAGRIYFGGVNGVTEIDPELVRQNQAVPAVYFTHVVVQTKDKRGQIDTSDLLIKQVDIPSNWLQATVSFSCINYSNPSKVNYQYRLKESDSSWVNLGNRDLINFIGVSPGTYHLETRALNEDGYVSVAKAIVLVIQPQWYQTWWFYLSVVLLLAAGAWGLYHARVRQIKAEQTRLRGVRQEIASDLHDDIGSVLNAIKIFAHLAERSPEKKYFSSIKTSLKQASEGLRDMIWVLDDNNDSADELLNRVQLFLRPVADASGVSLIIHKELASKIILGKKEKRNLLMIAKEAVNNSLKYAECHTITIWFLVNERERILQIEDDGKGYDKEKVLLGNGIRNISIRAKQIGYEVQVDTAFGKGVKLVLTSAGSHF